MSVELKNVTYTIKDKVILNDVSFKIETGEFVSLLGASGAGKTTTIKIIAGILEQTAGEVFINAKQVDDLPAYKRKVSIAFQDMRLFPHMTVGENVAFPMRMQGVKKSERHEKADYYLDLVQLKDFGSRKVDQLSGGQQQRVALARAVAASPAVLLLDEPFSGLDENLRDDMRAIVRSLHDKLKMTTAMITHNATEALTMSDHIIYMNDGKVVQYATPHELYKAPSTSDVALCFGNAFDIVGAVENGVFRYNALEFATNCSDGDAVGVFRFEGLKLEEDSSSGIVVLSCSFGGESYQTVLSLGQQKLTLTSREPIAIGTHVSIRPEEGSYFIYPKVECVSEERVDL